MKIRIVNILALLALVMSTVGCATQSPYSGLASAIAAINPALAEPASQLERALTAASKKPETAKAIDLDAVMEAAGYAKVERYFFQGTECSKTDFKKTRGYTQDLIGDAVFEDPAPVVIDEDDAAFDSDMWLELLTGKLDALEKKAK